MSGIYGIYRFNGAPVERETLALMRNAMAYYGPDGGGELCEGSVGLGHLLLKTTPEDNFENQPVNKDSINLVTFARLDNRNELLRRFEVPSSDWSAMPDSELVMKAYIRWGEDCLDHINGDWQFAAWDSKTRKLFVARDHHGNTGLYYYRNSNFIAFASSQKALLALPGVPCRPDIIKMAQILTAWPGEGWRSSHEDIHRLPPAHVLRASQSSFHTWRYWFPEKLPILKRVNEQDYVDEFLDIYRQAVNVRLRSAKPVGVTLSGGLDSGSVTVLAAPLLAAEGKRLAAFTSVPLYDPVGAGATRTGDEWQLAADTAKMAGENVDHFPVKAEGVSVIDGIRRQLRLQDGPVHGASNMYWIHDLMANARARGIGSLLTGQCGNGTVSFAGNEGQFLPLLLKGEYRLARETLLNSESSLKAVIKNQVIKPLLLPGISFYRNLKDQPWRNYSAINPAFAHSINLNKLMRNAGHDPTFTGTLFNNKQLAILKLGVSVIGATWHEIGAGYGIDVRDPTIDRRVIEYCLQLPNSQYRLRGESRRLIRNSMSACMPRNVLYNSKNGLQAADMAKRMFFELPILGELWTQLCKNHNVKYCLDMQLIDTVIKSLEERISVENCAKLDYILSRGLSVGFFLQGVESYK